MRVVSFGEILWDIIDGVPHLGGAPFNFAAHAVQCGSEASMISCVGRDGFGEEAIKRATELGLDTSWIETNDTLPTGTVEVTLQHGQPDYTIKTNVAYDVIQGPSSFIVGADVFYFGTLAQRDQRSRSALYHLLTKGKFSHVFYDVNLRKESYTKEIISESLAYCTLLKLNEDEVHTLSPLLFNRSGDVAGFCTTLQHHYPNIRIIIVTAGERGCFIHEGGHLVHIPGKMVEVQDAVGAGDSFSAAFMHAYTRTGDVIESGRVANEVGAYVASCAGAIPEYSPELRRILQF